MSPTSTVRTCRPRPTRHRGKHRAAAVTAAARCLLAAATGLILLAAAAPAPALPARPSDGHDANTASGAPRSGAAAAPALRVYFGDLHGHTRFSDGKGTPEQAFTQAAGGGADFLAVTDHREGLTATEWARTQTAAAAATTAAFVGIPAYEVRAAIGHLNIYDTAELPPAGLTGAVLYDWISTQGAIGEWNHPLRNGEDFAGYAYRTAERDAAISLLEIVNHGSVPLEPHYEKSYVRALDKGWHVMPAANGDVHDATWITGNDERTALLATSLTRDALYEAMRARRGYATKLDGVLIEYTVGGAQMGSTVAAAPGKLTVAVRVRGRDAAKGLTYGRLDVVSNGGKVVATSPRDGKTLTWTARVPAVAGRYYYLRVWAKVLFLDTRVAWTAPVWVERPSASSRPAGD